MRSYVRGLAAAILVGGPTAVAFFSGGFFDRPRLIAAIAAWMLVIAVVLFGARPVPKSTAGRAAAAGLALLTAWTAISLSWAPLGGSAQDDLQRLLLYLGFFIAAMSLLRGAGVRHWLEPALVLGTFVIVAYGLSERLVPGLIELNRSQTASGRLEQPITYWNAFGAVAAMGLVLAVRVAGDPDRGKALRAAAAGAGVPLGLGVYLSFSRGALAAVAAGLLVLLWLAPAGRPQLRSIIVIIGAGALAILVASALPTVQSLDLGEQGSSGEGLLMLATLVLLATGAAAMVARPPRRRLVVSRLGLSRRGAVLALTLVALATLALAATLEGRPEGVSPAAGASPTRFGSIDTNRYLYWDVALEAWADHPVLGTGSGGFATEWAKVRDRVDSAGDAHSLYLETAAELGVVGLGLLLVFLAGVGAGVTRLHRLNPGAATGLAAGLFAWVIHAGLDWDWEMPAVTLPALVLGGAAIAWSEELSPGTSPAVPADPGHEDIAPSSEHLGAVASPPAADKLASPRH